MTRSWHLSPEALERRMAKPPSPPPVGACICGLPTNADGVRCKLCELEGCDGFDVPYIEEWDGETYPSRRKHRIGDDPIKNIDAWHLLLKWWFVTGPTMPRYGASEKSHMPGGESWGPRQPQPRTFLDDILDAPQARAA